MLTNIFKTKDGQIVIGQFPNPPLFFAGFLYLFRYVDVNLAFFSQVSTGIVMLYWAYLEITQGVNTWRKILGTVVSAYFLLKILERLNLF